MAVITLIVERGREGDPRAMYAQYGEFRRALSRRIERLARVSGKTPAFDGVDIRGKHCWILEMDDAMVGKFTAFVTGLMARWPLAANVRIISAK